MSQLHDNLGPLDASSEAAPIRPGPRKTERRSLPACASFLFVLLVLVTAPCVLLADDDVVRELDTKDVQAGQRLRVIRKSGAPFVGTVVSCSEKLVYLDLAGELHGLNARIGIPTRTIRKLELLSPLSDADRKAAASARRVEAEQALARARKKTADAGPTDTEADTPTGKTDAADDETERPVLSDEQFLLLRAFPPSRWGSERLAQIRQRWILRDLGPTALESDFIRLYPQWEKAVAQLEAVKTWEGNHRDVVLMETFPPDEGWSPERRNQIAAKQDVGAELEALEAEFLQVYTEWLKALETAKVTDKAAEAKDKPEEPAAVPTDKTPKP